MKNKHFFGVMIIAALLLVSLLAYSSGQPVHAEENGNLVIIHTNDVHGYLEASDSCLGIAAVAALKNEYEENGYEVLLLDAGDALQGNIFVNQSDGENAVTLMNEVGYDAMALGNHEFDYGADVLEERIEECDFPVLCANITIDATEKSFAQENTVFALSDGTKVGIFGLDTPSTLTSSSPKNTAGLSFLTEDALYEAAQEQIDLLKEKGCSVIICLGHLGDEDINKGNNAIDVIENTSGLDIFIDGHDHLVKNEYIKDRDGKDVLHVETGCYLQNIGVITSDGSEFAESLVQAGNYEGSEQKIAEKVSEISEELQKSLGKKIAETAFDLNGERSPGNRDSETNLGDLTADAVLWQANQSALQPADAAIVNGGGIRQTIKAGDITLLDAHAVFPFNNQLYTIEVTGAQLLEALEAATQAYPDPEGSFPQVARIQYTIDATKEYKKGEQYPGTTYFAPADPGSRVTIIEVGGKKFDKDATYKLASNEFVVTGGDTYYCFAEAADKTKASVGYLDYDALVNYMQTELEGIIPDTYSKPQGRITIINTGNTP